MHGHVLGRVQSVITPLSCPEGHSHVDKTTIFVGRPPGLTRVPETTVEQPIAQPQVISQTNPNSVYLTGDTQNEHKICQTRVTEKNLLH